MFETPRDYHQLNAGAHRSSPENLHAPVLTWHLAFWLVEQRAAKAKENLDNFLLALYKALREDNTGAVTNVHLCPCASGIVLLFCKAAFDSSLDEIESPLDSPLLSARQKDMFNNDGRDITLRFRWHELAVAIRCEVFEEYFSITTYAKVEKGKAPPYSDLLDLNERILEAHSYFKTDDPPESAAGRFHDYFFRTFWTSYSDHVLAYKNVAALLSSDSIFKHVFADFRGILLSDETVRFPDYGLFKCKNGLGWGVEAKKKLLPLLNIPRFLPPQQQYECTVSYMLGGRALHVSALAPQIPDAPDAQRIPVEFIVYAHQHEYFPRAWLGGKETEAPINTWQLGRLINQIDFVETLRLAALRNARQLHEAEEGLSKLDLIIQEARDKVATSPPTAMELIQKTHSDFNAVAGAFRTVSRCDLSYRIERSRHYVSQFRANAKLLRITRLEGDQPYDQFVERRLGTEFDFIDLLGQRYELIARNISTLDQNYLAIQTAELAEQRTTIDERIHKIQEFGELVLFAAPAPYYVAHLFEHVAPEKDMPIMTINIWILLFATGLTRYFKKPIILPAALLAFFISMANWLWPFPLQEHEEVVILKEIGNRQKELADEQAKIIREEVRNFELQGKEQIAIIEQLLEGQKDQIRLQNKLLLYGPFHRGAPLPPPRGHR